MSSRASRRLRLLDSYEAERAPVVRRMVELSRRLGFVIMPTSRACRLGARLHLRLPQHVVAVSAPSSARGGVLPPPAIGRSVLTAGSGIR